MLLHILKFHIVSPINKIRIMGFFDNLNVYQDRPTHTIGNLGSSDGVAQWILSFLTSGWH
jgi:hypothetical protein